MINGMNGCPSLSTRSKTYTRTPLATAAAHGSSPYMRDFAAWHEHKAILARRWSDWCLCNARCTHKPLHQAPSCVSLCHRAPTMLQVSFRPAASQGIRSQRCRVVQRELEKLTPAGTKCAPQCTSRRSRPRKSRIACVQPHRSLISRATACSHQPPAHDQSQYEDGWPN